MPERPATCKSRLQVQPGIWNFHTLGAGHLVTEPPRPMPLPQFSYPLKPEAALPKDSGHPT